MIEEQYIDRIKHTYSRHHSCDDDLAYARTLSAYSGAKKPPVPENHGHPFRLIAATRSGNSRPPIPENHGHFVSPLA